MDQTLDHERLYRAIFKRKSVRNYSSGKLDFKTMEGIVSQIGSLEPLVPDIATEIRIISGDEVRGMFKVDAPHFMAFFSEPKERYLSNAGFMLQQMDLSLSANGIGSCWQGGPRLTAKTKTESNLEFVTMLAFGPPSDRIHRSSLTEFQRTHLERISNVKDSGELLEPARLAPSAMNNQPWFFTGGEGMVHAHCARSLVAGRMNPISTGIAICHVWLAALHHGKEVRFGFDKGMASPAPAHYSYVASLITS